MIKRYSFVLYPENYTEDMNAVMEKEENPNGSYVLYEDVISVFEDIKNRFDDWYMKREKVSLAMMMEREELFRKCDWALERLKGV